MNPIKPPTNLEIARHIARLLSKTNPVPRDPETTWPECVCRQGSSDSCPVCAAAQDILIFGDAAHEN